MNKVVTMLYFAEDGNALEALRTATLEQLRARRKSLNDLRKEYGANALSDRNGQPVGLFWLAPKGSIALPRPGLVYCGDSPGEGLDDVYHQYRPDRRYKVGREMVKRFLAFSPLDGSAILCAALKADDQYIAGYHADSLSGHALYCAAAGISKGRIVLKVPTTPEEPFSTPAGMVQLKHSEFVALTEE